MKNKHISFYTYKKLRWLKFFDVKRNRWAKRKRFFWVTRRRSIRMSNRRAVYYKKRRYWSNSLRPHMNRKPYWRWKSHKAVHTAKRALKALSYLTFAGSRFSKKFVLVSNKNAQLYLTKKRLRLLQRFNPLSARQDYYRFKQEGLVGDASFDSERASFSSDPLVLANSTAVPADDFSDSVPITDQARLKDLLRAEEVSALLGAAESGLSNKFILKKLGLNFRSFLKFLRSNSRRQFYKYKLYSNLYIARIFEFASRKNLYQFRKFLKQKRTRLGFFIHYFLNRLDFCLLRWNVDWHLWTLRKVQLMISHGLVLVNFQRKKSYLYRLKSSDFVLICVGGQNAFNAYWKLNRPSFLKYGKTKYRPGYPRVEGKTKWVKRLHRILRLRREGRRSDGFRPDDPSLKVFFYSFIFTGWNHSFFKYYHHFYEVSRRIRGYVYIVPARHLITAKKMLAQSATKIFLYRWLNYFVNMSFH